MGAEVSKGRNDYLGGKMKVVTITIEESTLQLLKALKEETSSKNFDDAIRKLAGMKVSKSMFGVHPEMSSFTDKDRIRFHEL
jgi:predicted CopG family antitoxin